VSTASPRLGPTERLSPARHRRFSVEEYHRMIAAGILGEDEHVELLEGEIVQMSPQNDPHMKALVAANRFFSRRLPLEFEVRPQGPLTFDDSEPEPDLAIVRAADHPKGRHPSTALLVIEVADSSVRYDLNVKSRIYSKAGIAEYWLFVVPQRQVEVLTDPDLKRGLYRKRRTLTVKDVLRPAFRRGLALPVKDLFD
jgi:Uma2 family endonuclease